MREEDIRKRDVFNRYLDLSRKDAENFFANHNRFIDIQCPACNSGNYQYEFDKYGFTYVSCPVCHTLFVNPRPAFDDLIRFYADSPSTHYWVEEFFKPVAEVRREKIFRPRAEYVTEVLPNLNNGVIGDIGAGFGIFLEEIRRLWPSRLIAIEPSIDQAEICLGKGIEVQCCALEELQGFENEFDLLTCFELFEHLHTPVDFVQRVFKLLKPGGHFLMTTLNGQGFDIQLLWDKSKSISPPQHINFFNTTSITLLLQRCGFQIVDVSTPGKLDWDIVEGMIKNEETSLERFWHLLSRQGNELCKNEFQDWIARNKFSSHMRVLARK
ncbi:methyltransferase domain-containing protein [Syntrophomonas wolfei]|uniref:methyltransferase domain-containing protein n=1 Tax=Syntrophomonas wolfei TaxID=863 RepID=UPI000773B640|nr:methyltransferase domain-containing protein [Syntrophomonas wolfei]